MSGMIPEQNDERKHVYHLIADGMKKRIAVKGENDEITYQTVLDEKRAWLKTGQVPSPYYGNYTKEEEDFRNLSDQAFKYMPEERARSLAQDILLECASFDASIDAMSSMTMRDKTHSQASLLDKGFKNKSERDITIKDEAKRSFMEALTGKEKQDSASAY